MARTAVITGGASALGRASTARLAEDGNPSMSAYSATKAAVIDLTRYLGKELATSSVLVNAIAPAGSP